MNFHAVPGVQRVCMSGARALVIAFSSCVALAAWAQSLKIPDFRQLAAPPTAQLKPGERCNACGRVLSIREIPLERKANVPQAFQSGGVGTPSGPGGPNLVGAVIYLPLGGESTGRPFVGGVGTPQMQERFQETTYEIGMRLDDGSLRFLQRPDGSSYQVGDRLRITDSGQLELITN